MRGYEVVKGTKTASEGGEPQPKVWHFGIIVEIYWTKTKGWQGREWRRGGDCVEVGGAGVGRL